MNHRNFINLDIHTQSEGRCLFQVGIDGLTPKERAWLFRLFEQTKEGREVSFGVDSNDAGEHVIKFTLGSVAESVQ